MKVFLRNGKNVRVAKKEAVEIIDSLFGDGGEAKYIRILRNNKSIKIISIADIVLVE